MWMVVPVKVFNNGEMISLSWHYNLQSKSGVPRSSKRPRYLPHKGHPHCLRAVLTLYKPRQEEAALDGVVRSPDSETNAVHVPGNEVRQSLLRE